MSGLDTTPLKDMAIAYLETDSKSMTLAENEMLDELVEMFSDFDGRFVQYPLLAAGVIAHCVKTAYVDHEAILRCLEVLIRADHLSRRGR